MICRIANHHPDTLYAPAELHMVNEGVMLEVFYVDIFPPLVCLVLVLNLVLALSCLSSLSLVFLLPRKTKYGSAGYAVIAKQITPISKCSKLLKPFYKHVVQVSNSCQCANEFKKLSSLSPVDLSRFTQQIDSNQSKLCICYGERADNFLCMMKLL